jgi:hypothetical protein
MKQTFTLLFFLTVLTALGQANEQVDKLNFCIQERDVPTSCVAESQYQLQCDNYSIQWLYMNEEMLQAMPEQFVAQLSGQMKKFKKESITCYLLDTEAKGYKISFKTDTGIAHQIIAYGTANNQPVLVQLSLDKEPKSNEDTPAVPRQIVRLTK